MQLHFYKTLLILLLTTNNLTTKAQQSFDGDIKNNSLAISPDESIAVASYSDAVMEHHPELT